TISPPRTTRARPSSSPVSLSPPSPRKAAWMLTRRIVDQILPANSIAEVEAQSPAPQSTAPRIAVGLLILCVLGEAALLRLGIDDAPVRWEPHPGWPSTAFAVLAAWCLSHPPSTRWLVASGLSAGASYLFKQNTGAFMLIAAIISLSLWERAGVRVPKEHE